LVEKPRWTHLLLSPSANQSLCHGNARDARRNDTVALFFSTERGKNYRGNK